jgi:hypothetical protein
MHSTTPVPTEAPKATEETRQDLFLSASKSLLVTPKELYSPTLVNGLFTPPNGCAKNSRRGSLPLKKRRVISFSEAEDLYEDSPFRADHRRRPPFPFCGGRLPREDDVNGPSLPHWKLSEPYLPSYQEHHPPFHSLDENQKKLISLLATPHEASFPSLASSFERVQSRSPPESSRKSSTEVANDSPSQHQPPHLVSPQAIPAASTPSAGLGQDKRYTGLSPDQVRCPATTTRGRPCAYQAVTKYCHLHADYDIHPPPRRKTHDDDDDKTPDATAAASLGRSATTPEESSLSERTGPSPVVSVESTAPFKRRHRTNAKWAVKHAEAPHPLLSMMATDQWQGQAVRVAVGPFTGRVGTVNKWGNGWITIFIPDVGFHNRRSFELYLVAEEKEKKTLFRCVSRDGVSPAPHRRETPPVTPLATSHRPGIFRPALGERTRSTSRDSPSPP